MKTSLEEQKRYTFDSYCKKILRNEVRDFYKEIKYQRDNVINFSEMSNIQFENLSYEDKYFQGTYSFNVLGYDIVVSDENLGEALQSLSEDKLKIILLSFHFDMTDREIAEQMNLIRRTVTYRRKSILQSLRKFMEENKDE